MDEATLGELRELAADLDGGRITTLRDRYPNRRKVRQIMSRYTDAIWLFPFGAAPDLRHPVQVFHNGMSVLMDDEATLVRVGSKHPLVVVVLEPPGREGDAVQATYHAKPEVGR